MKKIVIHISDNDFNDIRKICKGLRISPQTFCEGCVESLLDIFLKELGYE